MKTAFRAPALPAAAILFAGTAFVGVTAVPARAADDPAKSATPVHSATVLFKGGRTESLNGISYHSFRIPSIVRTKAGTLLAFAEGRASSNKDWGNINLVYKRSIDNGATWSGLKEVVGAGQGTWGNPTPVVDMQTGTIWMFMSWNPAGYSQTGGYDPDTGTTTTPITKWGDRRTYLMRSTDDGVSFKGLDGTSTPTDMTETLTPKKKANGAEWAWDAMGPGNGVYTREGHLVVPAQHRNIVSTDHGQTWRVQKLGEQTGEATIAQLADGTLYRNDRPTTSTWETAKRRWVSRGSATGTFSAFAPDDTLLDPKCEASVLQYNNDAPARTVFLNPASTVQRADKMRVRISYDNARTWPVSRPLSDGPLPAGAGTEGGYSSMAKTSDYRIAALVESNLDTSSNGTSYRSIIFRKFNLSWILNGG
ncbi:sialidase family protein [Actinomadura miaoliensis]|uniref:exo-alpha-sialidase n=1 Tax=Actinomadura miaoliensis TaxID=430685 RepID=A0ABP7WHK6_9ACTN